MKKNLTMILAVSAAAMALTTAAFADEAKSFKIATDTVFKPFEYPDESGEQITDTRHAEMLFRMQIPESAPPYTIVRTASSPCSES